MRIVQLSDVHVWRYSYNPLRLFNKRVVGIVSLLAGRADRFRLERLDEVVRRIKEVDPDHLLITGDLTTDRPPRRVRRRPRRPRAAPDRHGTGDGRPREP